MGAKIRYRAQVEEIKKKVSLANLFRQNYEIWIGYHAILQHQSLKENGFSQYLNSDNSDAEKQQDIERAIVAEMQVKQAYYNADIQIKNLKVQQENE